MGTLVLKCNNNNYQLIEEKQDEDKDFPAVSLQACRHGAVWWVNKMAHSDYMRDLIKYLRLVLTGQDCQLKLLNGNI